MLERWYRWVWTRVGGKPWTYIIRDSARNYPLPWFIGWLFFGILIGHIWW